MPRRKKPTTIKEVRVSQNLSQAEFAKVIGVSTPSVRSIFFCLKGSVMANPKISKRRINKSFELISFI